VSSSSWFVISTKVRREHVACEHLARRGVESFLPRILEHRRGQPRIAPLFPGYLFVHIDLLRQYFDVVWAPGVQKFVAFGSLPCPLDDTVLEFLRVRTGADGVLRPVRVLNVGDTVRVNEGPFAGLMGIIENPGSSRGRVQVLMELLRRQTRVELPQEIVERVSA
jgi:transcriptional antiterminator RfaH